MKKSNLKTNEEYSGLHKHIQINFNVHIPQKKPVMNYKLMGLIGTKEKENLRYFQKETGIMKNIIDKANKFREDEEVVEVYDYEKMRDDREKMTYKDSIQDGIKEGINQGIQEGIYKKKFQSQKIC